MTHYEQHCPVARATEVLGDPWTLLVIRELCHGNTRLPDIASGVPGMSASLLAARLRKLGDAGLITRSGATPAETTYALTDAGRELEPVIEHLGRWGRRWLPQPGTRELKPALLLLDIARGIDRSRLPEQPVTIAFRFTEVPHPHRWWMELSRAEVSTRHTDPRRPSVVDIDCTLSALAGVWLGHIPWLEALREGTIRFTGGRDAVRSAVTWLGTSRFCGENITNSSESVNRIQYSKAWSVTSIDRNGQAGLVRRAST